MALVTFIEATDLNDAWFQALHKIMGKGRKYLITKGSNEGIHRAGLPIIIEIKYPGVRPLAVIMPGGSNLAPPTTQDDIEEYASYLMTPVRAPNEHYTYGEDLYWQMEWVIKHYHKDEGGHGNNHCYMTVGRPETVHHYDTDVEYSEVIVVTSRETGKDIRVYDRSNAWNRNPDNKPSSQCLRGIDTWIDKGKLHFWVYFRSWDHWGGFPVNLGGIQLMKEYMASQIGVEDGSLIVSSKDLHVYEHTWIVALMRLGKYEKEE
ncbi:MAG: thymidylate synthase [Candidatus Portnoybacteria bacterium]|nr:thymidylate synthase [Candidatus Portnoybacteria bacterium]